MNYQAIDKILSIVDVDQNGTIEFSEFLVTTVDPMMMLGKDKILKAFKDFDEDDSGSISISEL